MFPSTAKGMAEHDFRPGENAPEAGVYLVVHAGHRPEHHVTLFRGDQFPPCGRCGEEVRFRLVRAAGAIAEDQDFKR